MLAWKMSEPTMQEPHLFVVLFACRRIVLPYALELSTRVFVASSVRVLTKATTNGESIFLFFSFFWCMSTDTAGDRCDGTSREALIRRTIRNKPTPAVQSIKHANPPQSEIRAPYPPAPPLPVSVRGFIISAESASVISQTPPTSVDELR